MMIHSDDKQEEKLPFHITFVVVAFLLQGQGNPKHPCYGHVKFPILLH